MKNTLKITAILFLLTFALQSCSKDDEPVVLKASNLQIIAGEDQTGSINTDLAEPIEILINDQNGNPFAGAIVSFSATEGTVTPNTATTDATGKATVIWTLGNTLGATSTLTVTTSNDGTELTGSPATTTARTIGCKTYTNNTQQEIPDLGDISSIITVTDAFVVLDVNVTINIEHTWVEDLDIFLSLGGTSIDLTSDNGGSDDNYTNTIFDDDASTSIIDGAAPFTGSFRPETALVFFNDNSSNGNWRLSISDDDDGVIGTLLNWSIELCVE